MGTFTVCCGCHELVSYPLLQCVVGSPLFCGWVSLLVSRHLQGVSDEEFQIWYIVQCVVEISVLACCKVSVRCSRRFIGRHVQKRCRCVHSPVRWRQCRTQVTEAICWPTLRCWAIRGSSGKLIMVYALGISLAAFFCWRRDICSSAIGSKSPL